MKSVTYLRRSKRKTKTEKDSALNTLSVEDQRKRAEALEASAGYEHVREFVDDGVSAWREDVERPAFAALCAEIASGSVGVVVADAPDRLSRAGGRAYLAFRDLCREHGVKIHTGSHGVDECADDFTEIPAYLSGFLARAASTEKSIKLRNRSTLRAQAGEGRNAGPRPFGWAEDRKALDPIESELLRAAAKRVLKDGGAAAVAREWNEAGVPTTRGKQWTVASVKAALLRPRNAGLSVLRGEIVEGVTGQWTPLWDRAQHNALVGKYGSQGGGRKPTSHLLSGILKCACGASMRAANAGAGSKVYRCTIQTDRKRKDGREHFTIGQTVADDIALKNLVSALTRTTATPEGDAPEVVRLAALYARQAEIPGEVARLVAAIKSGALMPEDVAADRAALDAEAQQIAAEIDAVSAESTTAAIVADLRRSMLSGPRFDPERLQDAQAQVRARLADAPLEDVRALLRAHLTLTVTRSGRGGGYGADRIEVLPR